MIVSLQLRENPVRENKESAILLRKTIFFQSSVLLYQLLGAIAGEVDGQLGLLAGSLSPKHKAAAVFRVANIRTGTKR